MYKCGWNGCEKAYGTLNHLNAHVTMQSHGTKRTPEGMKLHDFTLFFLCTADTPDAEFKEIRKEWKQRKKEDDNARKAEEERQRQHNHAAAAAAAASQPGVPVDGQHAGHVVHDGMPQGHNGYHAQVRHLPPPLGYAPANSAVHTPYVGHSPIEAMPQYHGTGMAGYYPPSPYGGSSHMYQESQYQSSNENSLVHADS
jgi:hypothetical protein